MSKGFYNILDFDGAKANVFKESVFDGEQLVVTDVSDITIVGDNSTLLIEPRYATVLTFRNCSNIKIIGLTLGHVPQKGSCAGAVLRFEGCDNIQLVYCIIDISLNNLPVFPSNCVDFAQRCHRIASFSRLVDEKTFCVI